MTVLRLMAAAEGGCLPPALARAPRGYWQPKKAGQAA